jgi:alkanesulfonate monooxygenase SsuD/methylene tetrahydromethanopterin reductase-like flavin-dependent oxidoreductase (luciferase family)
VCVEQAVLLESDPARARAAARAYLGFYLPGIAPYVRSLRALGFDDDDFAHGLSDRLVDALVAWGTETQIRDRIEAQFRAGASHVCILPLDPAGGLVPCRRTLAALAPA